jgi:purine nucleosidase
MSADRVPILLDTDIGSNVDDALALAYLVRQPRCELLGVTTVAGEPEVRARLVSAMCEAFGRPEVPIRSGLAHPLRISQQQPVATHKTVLARWPHREEFASEAAIEFLRETIRSRPGEVTLLSIGPVTNIAALFASDPQIPTLLRRHVLMGGAYTSETSETNIRCDPHAAALAFAADTPAVYCVGLDVTKRCRMSAPECRKLFGVGVSDRGGAARPVADVGVRACRRVPLDSGRRGIALLGEMLELFLEDRSEVTFNDPLAAASIFESNLIESEAGRVEVECERALTHFQSGASPMRHHVAVDVNPSAFFKHYIEVTMGAAEAVSWR